MAADYRGVLDAKPAVAMLRRGVMVVAQDSVRKIV
jgi:hypothetical protein